MANVLRHFLDVISLDSAASTPQGVVMNESSISVLSDREEKYKQVTGFEYAIVTDANTTCSEANLPEGCKTYNDTATNTLYKFYYPRDDVVQYLYESYPQVSPIKGVTDEHFIVWMRTSFLPSFRNLYGVIHGNFVKGDKFVFTVNANYEVDSFNGQKSIVLTTMNNFGGKNPVLGETYKTTGSFGLIVGVFLIIKELLLL